MSEVRLNDRQAQLLKRIGGRIHQLEQQTAQIEQERAAMVAMALAAAEVEPGPWHLEVREGAVYVVVTPEEKNAGK